MLVQMFQASGFQLFGIIHWVFIVLPAMLSAFFLFSCSRWSESKQQKYANAIFFFGLVMVLAGCIERHVMPLQFCNATLLILVPGVLYWRSKVCADLLIGFSSMACLLAMITPILNAQSSWFSCITYFSYHAVNVLFSVYAVTVLKMKLNKRSIWSIVICVNLYAACVFLWDLHFHTDYCVLLYKPRYHTLFDAFSAWPWYIFEAELVGFFYAVICYLLLNSYRKKPVVTN